MPQSDPTFLLYGVIPGGTPDQMMASIVASTGLQESPPSSEGFKVEKYNLKDLKG
jgi:hypothetical protein